jgi:hypothetical protein
MRKSYKVLTAVAVAGLALAGGSAFTGTGVTTTGTAASAQFVGGTVSQSVTGATLDSIVYGFTDGTDSKVSTIRLTFTGTADGHAVTAGPAGGGAGVGTFSCSATSANVSDCTYTAGTDLFLGYTGLTSLDVTVS